MDIGSIGNILPFLGGQQAEKTDSASALEKNQKPGQDFQSMIVAKLMEAKDTDGDGALSVKEAGIPSEFFNQFDANKDGILDQKEIASTTASAQGIMDSLGGLGDLMKNIPFGGLIGSIGTIGAGAGKFMGTSKSHEHEHSA
ncbi:MAG: hypothetical protein A2X49_02360 [Lentisphaerae bacterium GWF2_52_8]|nr:MAG: hypothetical protein A2X49_02360 [Lentisphaerae bacterium GWF2_52_8]